VIRHVTATRDVTPAPEGGSLPAIVEADDVVEAPGRPEHRRGGLRASIRPVLADFP
jgi:hypothetical protein